MTTTDTTESSHWGDIDGVSIDFPMVVDEMHQLTLTYTVSLDAARSLLPGDAFEVLEVAPDAAMLIIALVDYVKNPWGDYNEINLGLLAHPTGEPERSGAFVWRMPVNQEFTKQAGNEVLGLPKTVEDLTYEYSDDTVAVRLAEGGVEVMTVRFPRQLSSDPATATEAVTWSYLDGKPTELPLVIEVGSAMIDPSAVELTLGTGPIADELRSLGLPRPADLAMYGEGLSGTFQAPRPA